VALRAFFCMGVIPGSTYLLTGLSVASCWIGGSADRLIAESVGRLIAGSVSRWIGGSVDR